MTATNSFVELTREEAMSKSCQHAAHCMIYAKGTFRQESLVMMQLRFDGSFGFVGGFVDDIETWEQALNRELQEEIGFDTQKHPITEENYVFSAYVHSDQLCIHFYALQLTHEEYEASERDLFKAEHFGTETMGLVRVPLFTYKRGRGFPTFLRNRFIGYARDQLIRGLKFAKLLTDNEISKALIEAENLT